MKPNLEEHPLQIIALLGQTSFDRILSILHLLQSWSGWMGALQITLLVYVRQDAAKLQALVQGFECPVQILDDASGTVASSFRSQMTKPVFGVEREIIFNSMRLQCGGDTICEAKRINRSSLETCIRKALRIQYQWLNDRITKFVDSKIIG